MKRLHPDHALEVTAAHEAGHITVGLFVGLTLDNVQLLPDGAITQWHDSPLLLDPQYATMAASGVAGELLVFGGFHPGSCKDDRKQWLSVEPKSVADFLDEVEKAHEILNDRGMQHSAIMSLLLTRWCNGQTKTTAEDFGDLLRFETDIPGFPVS